MTNQAVEAARAGDCVAVGELEVRVRTIDGETHDKIFITEPTLSACIAQLRAPSLVSCFDDANAEPPLHACFRSTMECRHALASLTLGDGVICVANDGEAATPPLFPEPPVTAEPPSSCNPAPQTTRSTGKTLLLFTAIGVAVDALWISAVLSSLRVQY